MRVSSEEHIDERFVSDIDALAKTVPIDAPWMAPRAAEWDAMTFADYLNSTSVSAEDRASMDITTMVSYAALPDAISLLYVLYYVHAAGGYKRLEGIDEDGRKRWYRFAGGSHVFALKMAEALGSAVRLSSPVTEIRGWDETSPVELVTPKGTVTTRRVILALSPSQAASIRFAPALPTAKVGLFQAWPAAGASGLKVFVSYAKPFWREQGLSGSIYNFDGTFVWAADASPDDESIGVLGTLGLTGDGLTTGSTQGGDLRVPRQMPGAGGNEADGLCRAGLGAGNLHPRLRLAAGERRSDYSRPRAAHADWASPMGRHRNLHSVDRIHGWRHSRWPARRR